MNAQAVLQQWHLQGPDSKAAGPFTAAQILEWWRHGEVADTTLCWSPGMADWQPLVSTAPFAGVIQTARLARRRRWRWVGIISGATAVVALIIYLVADALLHPGLGDFACYVPSDCKALGYCNVAKYLEVNEKLTAVPFVSRLPEIFKAGELRLKQEDIEDIFLVRTKQGRHVIVLRTQDDKTLSDLLPEGPDRGDEGSTSRSYARITARRRQGFLARTGPGTYCIASDEQTMKDTLRRLEVGHKPTLADDFQRAIRFASGADWYVAKVLAGGSDSWVEGRRGFVGEVHREESVIIGPNEEFAKRVEGFWKTAFSKPEETHLDMNYRRINAWRELIKGATARSSTRHGRTVYVTFKFQRDAVDRYHSAAGGPPPNELDWP